MVKAVDINSCLRYSVVERAVYSSHYVVALIAYYCRIYVSVTIAPAISFHWHPCKSVVVAIPFEWHPYKPTVLAMPFDWHRSNSIVLAIPFNVHPSKFILCGQFHLIGVFLNKCSINSNLLYSAGFEIQRADNHAFPFFRRYYVAGPLILDAAIGIWHTNVCMRMLFLQTAKNKQPMRLSIGIAAPIDSWGSPLIGIDRATYYGGCPLNKYLGQTFWHRNH